MGFHTSASGLLLPNSVRVNKLPSDDFNQIEVTARNGFVLFSRPTTDGSDMQTTQVNIVAARARLYAMETYLVKVKDLARDHTVMRDKIGPLQCFIDKLTRVIAQAEEQGPFEYEDMRRARVRSARTTFSISKEVPSCSQVQQSESNS